MYDAEFRHVKHLSSLYDYFVTYMSVRKKRITERKMRNRAKIIHWEMKNDFFQLNKTTCKSDLSLSRLPPSCCLSIFINTDLYPTNILLSSIHSDILNQQTTDMTTLLFSLSPVVFSSSLLLPSSSFLSFCHRLLLPWGYRRLINRKFFFFHIPDTYDAMDG